MADAARGEPTVRELAALMSEFGLTRLQSGDVILERPAFLSASLLPDKDKPIVEEDETDYERILRMSPDAQDRALALGPVKP